MSKRLLNFLIHRPTRCWIGQPSVASLLKRNPFIVLLQKLQSTDSMSSSEMPLIDLKPDPVRVDSSVSKYSFRCSINDPVIFSRKLSSWKISNLKIIKTNKC